MANNAKNSTVATSYIPHVLFIVAQVYCGAFIVFLMWPLLYNIFYSYQVGISKINFENLLNSFSSWWHILSSLKTRNITLIIFSCFPVGFIFTETFYRFATLPFIRYIKKDINLEDLEKDITNPSDIKHFKIRCGIQKYAYLQKVWDWENFQFIFCLYIEETLLVFDILFFSSIIYTVIISKFLIGNKLDTFCTITCIIIFAFSTVLFLLMKRARKLKLQKFHNANEAIKQILEKKESWLKD